MLTPEELLENVLPNPIDKDELWRHAFAYADCHTDIDRAAAYANHYVDVLCDHEDAYYPDHGPSFADWRDANDS
jgi:hypothetical protein